MKPTSRITRLDALPERSSLNRQFRRVVYPRGGSPLVCYPLTWRIDLIGTHYLPDYQRTVPCAGASCQLCLAMVVRPKGYLPALLFRTHEQVVCEITEGAVRRILAIPWWRDSARGSLLTLSRKGEKPNAPVYAHVETSQMRTDRLPSAFEVFPHLEDLWGIKRGENNV